MLRATIEHDAAAEPAEEPAEETPAASPAAWRVSSGSAAVLGLCAMRMEAAPTTAYLMLGERCARDCAFCTQARSSRASAAALSRVLWPEFPAEQAAEAIATAHDRGEIRRACFQVTVGPGHLERTRRAVAALAARSTVPICASVLPRNTEDAAMLLAAGAERVTIALDAACERAYLRHKSGSWSQALALLETCAARFPGRIGTHLIVGLGESEREMAERLQWAVDRGVHVALFAFTPVAGTAMAGEPPPPLAQYRRMQAARWLIVRGARDPVRQTSWFGPLADCGPSAGALRADRFQYTEDGRLADYGLTHETLRALLHSGDAFRTSGCPGCNRPYYNERPGGVLYNYPRPLSPAEAEREIAFLLEALS